MRQRVAAHRTHRHAKAQALAVELGNDWDAIFQVLAQPALPLTNNTAEHYIEYPVPPRWIGYLPSGSEYVARVVGL